MPNINPIPEGFHTVTPYLRCRDASAAIAFYKKAFGAKEIIRVTGPDGQGVMHATIQIGDARLMLSDEFPSHGVVSPLTLGGTAVSLQIYVADADAAFNQAVAAGATVKMPMTDMFWGDRYGQLRDPFGHEWAIASQQEKVSPEESQKRMAAAFAKGGDCDEAKV